MRRRHGCDGQRALFLGVSNEPCQVVKWRVLARDKGQLGLGDRAEVVKAVDIKRQLIAAVHKLDKNRNADAHANQIAARRTLGNAGEHCDAAAAGRWSSFLEDHADSEYAAAARRGLAWCAWRQGDAAGAAAACAAYLQRHGDLEGADEVRVLFGEVLLEAGAPERALEVLGEVSAADQLPAAWRGLGFAHAALGQHAQAAAAFARVPASSPLAAEAELQRGVELVRAKPTVYRGALAVEVAAGDSTHNVEAS